MATERQSPDALITQTNLTGVVAAIQDDPNSPDGTWLVPIDNGTDTICRASFPTPTGNPTQGAGLQQFQIWVKAVYTGTLKTPTVRIELRETGGGAALATPLGNTTVTNTTGILLGGTWDANLLATTNGSAVECYVYGTASVAGGNKSTIGVGAVEWNVDYSVLPTYKTVIGSLYAIGAVSKQHILLRTLNGAVYFVGSIVKKLSLSRILSGTLNFTGLVINNIAKSVSGALYSIGDLATQYIPSMVQKALSGIIAFTGTVAKKSTYKKILSGALAFAGGIASGFETTISGAVNFTGHLCKKFMVSIGAFLDNRNIKR